MILLSGASNPKYYVLTPEEVSFFTCFSSFIVPSGNDPEREPGAKEVGTVRYVDSTFFDLPEVVRDYFRTTIKMIEETSMKLFGNTFSNLTDSARNTVLRSMYLDPKSRERVFDIRSLALEGFYSDYTDPWYSGITGWQVIQFSGKRISDIKKDWSFLKVWRDWKESEKKKE